MASEHDSEQNRAVQASEMPAGCLTTMDLDNKEEEALRAMFRDNPDFLGDILESDEALTSSSDVARAVLKDIGSDLIKTRRTAGDDNLATSRKSMSIIGKIAGRLLNDSLDHLSPPEMSHKQAIEFVRSSFGLTTLEANALVTHIASIGLVRSLPARGIVSSGSDLA